MQEIHDGHALDEAVRMPTTRVTRACERCRRNKSRCDTYRPCSLCLRANARCVAGLSAAQRATTRRRIMTSPRSVPLIDTQCADRRQGWIGRRTLSLPPGGEDALESPASMTPKSGTASQTRFPSDPYGNPESAHDASGDSEPAINIARKIYRMERQTIEDTAINAIPGADIGNRLRASESVLQDTKAGTASYLVHALPDEETMVLLLEEYFESVHWFSLVVLEPKFRVAFDAVRGGFATPSEVPFLLLLSMVLGLAAWYRGHGSRSSDCRPAEFWQDWSKKLIANSESQIIEIMNQNSSTAIQVLILLGSFYVYHGRPNLSFSLLGATIKIAQAIGLHREAAGVSSLDREEKKRIWWTIYTWDRFASITYGRPLGISDKDCNISQPEDISEDTLFSDPKCSHRGDLICYSSYQRELNKLYLIASPAIKIIYSARTSLPRDAFDNLAHVRDVTAQLWKWRQQLPEHLLPRQADDNVATLTAGARAHCLQSLSLQLTFDSLIIVLHRPFLNHSFDLSNTVGERRQSNESGSVVQEMISPSSASEASLTVYMSSHMQWWEAAVRTSRVTETPQLAQFATDSHLVAFLAINLFNAAVVMVVVALSSPLTDRAQEAKRAVARVYRLQEMLGSRSTLSKQSSRVLRSLILVVLRRETDAMLAPFPKDNQVAADDSPSQVGECGPSRMTVRDALSISISAGATADSAPRFDHGLATVQKAFNCISGVELGPNNSTFSNQEASETQAQAAYADSISFDSDTTDLFENSQTSMLWNGGNAVDERDLYWFWNASWDDLYSGMGPSHP